MKAGLLKKFTVFDLVLLTMMAVLGGWPSNRLSCRWRRLLRVRFIFRAGGGRRGGFYMLWIILGCGLVDKRGAGTDRDYSGYSGHCPGDLRIAWSGQHFNLYCTRYFCRFIIYNFARRSTYFHACIVGGVVANVTGTVLVFFCIFPLAPPYPSAVKSRGGFFVRSMGGLIAFALLKYLKNLISVLPVR